MSTNYDNRASENSQETTDSQFADPDDFKVRRNGEGEALPQTVDTALGKVRVLPMSYGDVESTFNADGGDAQSISSDQIATLVEHHVIEPDLASDAGGKVTAEYIQHMKPLGPRELIFAILDASGIDADVEMQGGGSAEVDMRGN